MFRHLLLILPLALAQRDNILSSFTELDAPVAELEYCGDNHDVVLIRTTASSVFRSDNRGASFVKLTDVIQSVGSLHLTSKDSKLGRITNLIQSPVDKSLFLFKGSGGVNWVTEDCARTISAFNYGRRIDEFYFHPTVREWGVGSAWTRCSDFEDEPCRVHKQLMVTKNLGKSWDVISSYILQFHWAYNNLEKSIQKQIPKQRIYITRLRDQTGHQSANGWTSDVDMIKSDDFFETEEVIVIRGNKFLQADRYVLVAQAIEEGSSEIQLLTSYANNIEKFRPARLPIKKLDDHSYTVLDTSEGSVFININHYGFQSVYGNLYISDERGRDFSLSLMHNVRGIDGFCDFDKVWGLEGIYMANIIDLSAATEDLPQEQDTMSANKNKKGPTRPDAHITKTLITFNKGGTWQTLKAPEKTSSGRNFKCQDDECSLHLHSFSSKKFAQFYSLDSAPGIILGTGNVGKHLSTDPGAVGLFLSRDGGFTWQHVYKGSLIYEIGDHGGLIVAAHNLEETNTVLYTWNEGLSWSSFEFTDEPILVENIIIEPGATTQHFVIYGTKEDAGVAISVDFSGLHEPQCRNPDRPDDSSSDYERWTPHDSRRNSRCLMGKHIEIVRRKQEAECYNGEEFDRITFVEKCECTAEDYECDFGFHKTEMGTCVRQENADPEAGQCLDDEDFYTIPTGYRRVAGDVCIGGVSSTLEPQVYSCSSGFLTSNAWIILGFLGAVVAVLIVTTQGEKLKATYYQFKSATLGRGQYSSDFNKVPESMQDEDLLPGPEPLRLRSEKEEPGSDFLEL